MDNIMEYAEELNLWLIQHLTPISAEADPEVLSKYVIALIQKAPATSGENKEKALRQKCLKQLEIFLGNETTSFVDTLFDVIKNQSFLNRNVPQAESPLLEQHSSLQGLQQQPRKRPTSSKSSTDTSGPAASSSEVVGFAQSSSLKTNKRSRKHSDATSSSTSSKTNVESSSHQQSHYQPLGSVVSTSSLSSSMLPSSGSTSTSTGDVDMRTFGGSGGNNLADSSNVGNYELSTSSSSEILHSLGGSKNQNQYHQLDGSSSAAGVVSESSSSTTSSMVSSSSLGSGQAGSGHYSGHSSQYNLPPPSSSSSQIPSSGGSGPIKMVLSHPSSQLRSPALEPQHSFFAAQSAEQGNSGGSGASSTSTYPRASGPSSSSSTSRVGHSLTSSEKNRGNASSSSRGYTGSSHHQSSADNARSYHRGHHRRASSRSRSPSVDREQHQPYNSDDESDSSSSSSTSSQSSSDTSASERANSRKSSDRKKSSRRGHGRRSHSKSGSGGRGGASSGGGKRLSPLSNSRTASSNSRGVGQQQSGRSSAAASSTTPANYRPSGNSAPYEEIPASYRPSGRDNNRDSRDNRGGNCSNNFRHRQASPSSSSNRMTLSSNRGEPSNSSNRRTGGNYSSACSSSNNREAYSSGGNNNSNRSRRRSRDGGDSRSSQNQNQPSNYRPQQQSMYQPRSRATSGKGAMGRITSDFFDFDRLPMLEVGDLMHVADTTSASNKSGNKQTSTATTSSNPNPTIKSETASSSIEDISTAWSDTRHDLHHNSFAASSSNDEKKGYLVKGEDKEGNSEKMRKVDNEGGHEGNQGLSASSSSAIPSFSEHENPANAEGNIGNFPSLPGLSNFPALSGGNQSAFMQNSAFMDPEPYNPEAASIDQSQAMLMAQAMLPGFMNSGAGPLGPLGHLQVPHRFLAAAAAAAASFGDGGQFGGNNGNSGGGGRQRELLGVSLSGGEPYVPRGARSGGGGSYRDGGKGGRGRGGGSSYDPSSYSGAHYNSHRNSGNNGGGEKRSSNVIDIMTDRQSDSPIGTNQYNPLQNQEPYDPSDPGTTSTNATNTNVTEESPSTELSSGADFGLTPNDKTWLLVRKIPPKLNEISIIDKHFSKFGKVVNIKVCYENDPSSALIQFSNTFEATAAIRSTEAIFNNRFIKVYWAYQQLQGQQKDSSQQQKSGFRGGHAGGSNFYRGGNNKSSWANKQFGGGVAPNMEGRLGHHPSHFQQQPNMDQTFGDQQQQNSGPNYFQRKVVASGGGNLPQGPSRVPTGGESTAESGSTPPAAPIKIISPLERAAKMKELTSASQALSDAVANQRHLMGKMEAAKSPKEKSAIMKLLQSTLKNVTELKKAVEKLQADLTPTYRSSKTFNRGTSKTSATVSARESAPSTPSSLSETTEKDQASESVADEKEKDDNLSVGESSSEVADLNKYENVEARKEEAVVEDTGSDFQETSSRKRNLEAISELNSSESVEFSASNEVGGDNDEPVAKVSKLPLTTSILSASVSVFNGEEEEIDDSMVGSAAVDDEDTE